jgi:hypothetical protein
MSESENPWRFLSALDGSRELDRLIISKTRHEELDLVNHMVAGGRTSILYAASGNGKTSLLNAGVIPYFVNLGYAVFRTRPRPPWSEGDPVHAFHECMVREQWLPEPNLELTALVLKANSELADLPRDSVTRLLLARLEAQGERLSESIQARSADLATFLKKSSGERSLVKILRSVQSFLGPATKILIICDQFEELFVHYSRKSQLYNFVSQVAEVLGTDGLKVQFVFSMRDDCVGNMIEFRTVVPDIFARYYKLGPLSRKSAPPALELPLKKTQWQWGKGVIDRILADLAASFEMHAETQADSGFEPSEGGYIELPALQIVAEALWNSRESKELVRPGHTPFSMRHYELLNKICFN